MNAVVIRLRNLSKGPVAPAIVLALVLLLTLLSAQSAQPASGRGDWREDSCRSKVVKDAFGNIQWVEHRGTKRRNVCYGTKYQDIFWTKGGNDTVRSYEGPDKIHLGGGHDKAYANEGWDRIWTGEGEDIAYGGSGRDFFKERSGKGGPDWDCFVGGPGRDDGFIRDGDDLVLDDYWGGKGRDRYPQVDSFCDDGGNCVQDGVYQVEDGPCNHGQNCKSPGKPKNYCKNAASLVSP